MALKNELSLQFLHYIWFRKDRKVENTMVGFSSDFWDLKKLGWVDLGDHTNNIYILFLSFFEFINVFAQPKCEKKNVKKRQKND